MRYFSIIFLIFLNSCDYEKATAMMFDYLDGTDQVWTLSDSIANNILDDEIMADILQDKNKFNLYQANILNELVSCDSEKLKITKTKTRFFSENNLNAEGEVQYELDYTTIVNKFEWSKTTTDNIETEVNYKISNKCGEWNLRIGFILEKKNEIPKLVSLTLT